MDPDRTGLIQAAIEKLAQTAPVYWAVFDPSFDPILLPPHTDQFLKHVFQSPDRSNPAKPVSDALRFQRRRLSDAFPGSRIIHVDLATPAGNLACHACMLDDGGHGRAWLLRFVTSGATEDFDLLTRIGITGREAQILSYLPLGYTNRDIADAMDITVNGVKKHLRRIGRKLGAGGRTAILYQALMKKRELVLLEGVGRLSIGDP